MYSFLWLLPLLTNAFKEPNCLDGRTAIVHLFEWKWADIEQECARFLGPKGFCGVQVSPPNEHAVIDGSPWWQRYQPVSYKLVSRSGNEDEFRRMVNTCNHHKVRIYVDSVVNHMAANGGNGRGSAGSSYNPGNLDYSGVPFSSWDFNSCSKCPNPDCNIASHDYGNNPANVRNCRLVGLPDLDNGKEYVRQTHANFFNHMIDMGVAGFRIDAVKHMWPGDVSALVNRFHNVPGTGKPFVVQEVIDQGGEPIKATDYLGSGRVTEFRYGQHLGQVVQKKDGQKMKYLKNFGQAWGMLGGNDAMVFVDNHDNQRGHGGAGNVVTHRKPMQYKIATAFMLAWPYGFPRIMSSYYFNNGDQGPPGGGVGINDDGTCRDGWVCEHRWRQIANMVAFRNSAGSAPVTNWWDNSDNMIAFGRGDKAFIAFNNGGGYLDIKLQTGMQPGAYCDVISGNKENGRCTGTTVHVDNSRQATVKLSGNEDQSILAVHIGSKL